MERETRRKGRVPRVLVASAVMCWLSMAGCDEQTTPPPPPQGGGAGSGGALAGLAENPKSLLGRSAKSGKNVAAQLENKSAEAAGMAAELSGEAAPLEVGGLVWSVPTAWNRVTPSNPMRAAELRIPAEAVGASEGEAVVAFSGGIGGTVEQNIDRWASQMLAEGGGPSMAYPKTRNVAGCNVTLVEFEGTFRDSMPGATSQDRPGHAMKGAVVEGPGGLVFIKMTGPVELVRGASPTWDLMVDGMRKK